MSTQEILRILETANKEVREKYKSRIIGLFGSYARNEGNEQSDIDVLIEKEGKITLLDLSGLKLFLEERLNTKVDVVTTSALRDEVKEYVMKDLIYL